MIKLSPKKWLIIGLVILILGYLSNDSAEASQSQATISFKESVAPTQVVLTLFDQCTQAPLAHALFELRNDQNTLIFSKLQTNNQGKIVLKKLPYDAYTFIEIQPPFGYVSSRNTLHFTLTNKEPSLSLKMYNQKLPSSKTNPSLPQVGSNSSTLYFFVGCVSLSASIFLLMIKNKNRKKRG